MALVSSFFCINLCCVQSWGTGWRRGRSNAVSRLGPTVQWLERVGSALAGVAIRILARVVGDNVKELLDAMHGRATTLMGADVVAGKAGTRRSVLQRPTASGAEFAASLFASLVSDRDIATNVIRSGAYAELVDLLKGSHPSGVLVPVMQAIRYVAATAPPPPWRDVTSALCGPCVRGRPPWSKCWPWDVCVCLRVCVCVSVCMCVVCACENVGCVLTCLCVFVCSMPATPVSLLSSP